MSGRREQDAKRATAARLLAETAAENGGVPVWARVSKATGLDRKVLRRMWQKTGGSTATGAPRSVPPAALVPVSPTATDDARERARERARQLLRMGAVDFREEALAELILERDAANGDTARAALTVKIVEYSKEHRPPEEAPVDESTMGREAWEQWIVGQARELVDRDLELMLAVYAERHKARLVLVGQGGHRAELVDGAWVQTT
jgi:ribosomal protein L39E